MHGAVGPCVLGAILFDSPRARRVQSPPPPTVCLAILETQSHFNFIRKSFAESMSLTAGDARMSMESYGSINACSVDEVYFSLLPRRERLEYELSVDWIRGSFIIVDNAGFGDGDPAAPFPEYLSVLIDLEDIVKHSLLYLEDE
jgi:hypothetical protein